MGTINGIFIYNSAPQNGAVAKLWKITAFASYADSGETVSDDPLAATSVECNCSDGSVFAVGDVIKMESECCLIWKISTNKLYIIRGWHQTTPAEHAAATAIYDETITPPEQDDSEPGSGQQGSSVTTGVAYGGDGAYRFDAVPEMEYYASVYYSAHRSFIHHFIERNDITLEQLLLVDGDIVIRNGDTITRLPKGEVGRFLQMGANRPEWGTVGGLTKEFFIPATHGTAKTAIGDFPAYLCDAYIEYALVVFKVPNDFDSITSAEFIVIPKETEAAAHWDVLSDYGAVGQAYNIHNEQDIATDYNVTANQLFAVDISGILSALVANDYVGIRIQCRDGVDITDMYPLGVRFRYS